MNRQIEFRGKNLENEWVYGYLYIHEPPLTVCESKDESKRKYYILQTGIADWNMDRPKVWYEVDKETVGQFTGQLDKNNKKIFEDDYVKYPNGWSGDYQMKSSYEKVYWEECSSSFIIDKPDDVQYNECEVVGNKLEGMIKC